MSFIKIAHFVPIGQQTWPPHAILVSDWSISKKSSPLKLLSHMNQSLVGSIYMYGRFCIKFPQSRMKSERHRLSPLSLQYSLWFDSIVARNVGQQAYRTFYNLLTINKTECKKRKIYYDPFPTCNVVWNVLYLNLYFIVSAILDKIQIAGRKYI